MLEHGRLIGAGTHEELMENCPTYQEIAGSQLSNDELRRTSTEGSRPVRAALSPEEELQND